jgi:hypothetical protein
VCWIWYRFLLKVHCDWCYQEVVWTFKSWDL